MDFGTRKRAFGILGFRRQLRRWKKRTGMDRIVFFMFDVEPWSPSKIYKKYLKFTPYYYKPKMIADKIRHYDLSRPNTNYWKKFDRMLKIASEEGVKLIPNIFPCRYVSTVFKRVEHMARFSAVS